MAFELAGITSSDQLLMSPDQVVDMVILHNACAVGKEKQSLRRDLVTHVDKRRTDCITLH